MKTRTSRRRRPCPEQRGLYQVDAICLRAGRAALSVSLSPHVKYLPGCVKVTSAESPQNETHREASGSYNGDPGRQAPRRSPASPASPPPTWTVSTGTTGMLRTITARRHGAFSPLGSPTTSAARTLLSP